MKTKIQLLLILFSLIFVVKSRADVCADIVNVYENSMHSFSSWKGLYDKDLENYKSHYKLQNAKSCSVTDDEYDLIYRCSWKMTDVQSMYQAYESLVYSIKNCEINTLGKFNVYINHEDDGEEEDHRSFIDSNKRITFFEYPDKNISIEIKTTTRKSKKLDRYSHQIYFIFSGSKK